MSAGTFLPAQPDLNWHNPQVADAIEDVMRFWLDRGVDGFRIDVVYRLGKDPELRDNPWIPDRDPAEWGQHAQERIHNTDRPEAHAICRRFRRLLDGYGDRMAVGEVTILDPATIASYYGAGDELHLAFDFHLAHRGWDPTGIPEVVDALEAALPPGAWPCRCCSNHDVERHAARFGSDRARAAALLLLTLRGTPFLYQGEEIGMTGCAPPPGRERDVAGRDACRTPMQWDLSPNAGFCPPEVEPWLGVCADADGCNVAAQADAPDSLLHLYRELLSLRRATPALQRGSYERLPAPEGVFRFARHADTGSVEVAVNLTAEPRAVAVPGRCMLATHVGAEHGTLPANARAVYVS